MDPFDGIDLLDGMDAFDDSSSSDDDDIIFTTILEAMIHVVKQS